MRDFFTSLAAAPKPKKPQALKDAIAELQPLLRPATIPDGGSARLQKLFYGKKSAKGSKDKGSDSGKDKDKDKSSLKGKEKGKEKGTEKAAAAEDAGEKASAQPTAEPTIKLARNTTSVMALFQPIIAAATGGDYPKWHALLSRASAQDKAKYKEWLKLRSTPEQEAARAEIKRITAMAHPSAELKQKRRELHDSGPGQGKDWWKTAWSTPDESAVSTAPRTKLVRDGLALELRKEFWGDAGSSARAAARGNESDAALAWMASEGVARKKAFTKGALPASSAAGAPQAFVDCQWVPKAGTEGKVRPQAAPTKLIFDRLGDALVFA